MEKIYDVESVARRVLADGNIPEKNMPYVLTKLEGVINKTSLNMEKDIQFIADTTNPYTRKAFLEITGIKLDNIQKVARQQLWDFVGEKTPVKKWLTPCEVKKIVQNNIGKEVAIDNNKRYWNNGREVRTAYSTLGKLIGIDGNRIVYAVDGYEFSKHIDNVRDIIIDGKSQLGDIENEKTASSLFSPEVLKDCPKPITPDEAVQPDTKDISKDDRNKIKSRAGTKIRGGTGFTLFLYDKQDEVVISVFLPTGLMKSPEEIMIAVADLNACLSECYKEVCDRIEEMVVFDVYAHDFYEHGLSREDVHMFNDSVMYDYKLKTLRKDVVMEYLKETKDVVMEDYNRKK